MENKFTELQLKHQRELAENREKIQERKNRTHRLIVRGAIAEGMVDGAERMTDEEFQNRLIEMIKK